MFVSGVWAHTEEGQTKNIPVFQFDFCFRLSEKKRRFGGAGL